MKSEIAQASIAEVGLAVGLAGLAGGLCDIVSAMVVYGPVLQLGATPVTVLQSVASGIFGREAFSGGIAIAAVGLAAHMGISLVAAAAYVFAATRLVAMRRHPIACGLLFGVAVYFFMTKLVVPMSASPMAEPSTVGLFFIALSLNVFFFGVPIGIVTAVVLGRK
ncbi:MAG: hypothetical protein ABL889_00825 [Terricaulis sp.]